MSVVRYDKDKKKFRFDRRENGKRKVTFHEDEKYLKSMKEDFDHAQKGYFKLGAVTEVKKEVPQSGFIQEVLKKYFEVAMPKKAGSTQTKDEYYLNKFNDWLFEREIFQMSQLTGEVLERYQTYLLKEKGLAESTVNREFVPIKHFLGRAFRWKYTSEDLRQHVEKLPEPPSEAKAWSDDQLQSFMTEAPIWVTHVLRAMDYSGLRPFQIGELKYGDIDFEKGTFVTRSKKGGQWRLDTMLADERFLSLVRHRQEIARRIFKASPTDHVFLNSKNRKVTANALGLAIRKARKALGMDDLTAYGVRHKFGTDLDGLGASLKQIARLMGHSRTSTTERYVHERDETLRGLIEKKASVTQLHKHQKASR